MGTHLQADTGLLFNSQPIREKQAVEFTSWIDKGIKDGILDVEADEPIIIAGDLNVPLKMKPKGEIK